MTQSRQSIFKSAVLSAFGLMTGGALAMAAAAVPQTVVGPDQSANDLHIQTIQGQWILLRSDGHGAFIAFRCESSSHTLIPIVAANLAIRTISGSANVAVNGGKVQAIEISRIKPKYTGWAEIGYHPTNGGQTKF